MRNNYDKVYDMGILIQSAFMKTPVTKTIGQLTRQSAEIQLISTKGEGGLIQSRNQISEIIV